MAASPNDITVEKKKGYGSYVYDEMTNTFHYVGPPIPVADLQKTVVWPLEVYAVDSEPIILRTPLDQN